MLSTMPSKKNKQKKVQDVVTIKSAAPDTPRRKSDAKAADAPSSPVPSSRVDNFSTPTRARKSMTPEPVTPKSEKVISMASLENEGDEHNKRSSSSRLPVRGSFGKKGAKPALTIDPKVQKVYKLINKCTGALGGNGYDGAIYGELTMHSMQKVII